MRNVFGDGMAEGSFAKEDHPVEAFIFDGADESFGDTDLATQTFSGGPAASGIVIADNGDLLVAGAASSSFVVAEFNCSSGAMESSYNSSGATSIAVPSSGYNLEYIGMAVSPDGDLILLGTYTYSIPDVGISSAPALWAVTPQGAPDMSFGSSGVHGIVAAYSLFPGYTQVAVNGDGQIFVGTAITTPGSGHTAATVSMKVLEFDADGSADTSFGTSGIATTGTISGDGSGLILQIQLNGQIVVGFGGTGGGGHFVLARFNGSGGLDSTFGSSGIEVGAAEGGGLAMVTASNGETVMIGKPSSGNGIILQEFGTLADSQVLYPTFDADFNTTSLTNSSGGVLERYSTDAYGNVTVLNADGSVRGDGTLASSFYAWVYLGQGKRYSVSTGTVDYNARVYILGLSRFAQLDPAGDIDAINRYQYEDSNSINKTDPNGTDPNSNEIERLDKEIDAIQQELQKLKEEGLGPDSSLVMQLTAAISKRYRDLDKLLKQQIPKPTPPNPDLNREIDPPPLPEVPSTPPDRITLPPCPDNALKVPQAPGNQAPVPTPSLQPSPVVPPVIPVLPPTPSTAPILPNFSFRIGPNGQRQLIIGGVVVATGLAAYILLAALAAAAAPAGA